MKNTGSIKFQIMDSFQIRIFFIVFGFLMFGTFTSGAQEAIPAAGGTATGQGGSVSFTVGQVVYTHLSGQEQSVIQGVQQSHEISVVTSVDEIPFSGIDVQAYPNPASDFVTLHIESGLNDHYQTLTYELFDLAGQVLEEKTISADLTNIPMVHLAPATYLLKVYNSSGTRSSEPNPFVNSKTFKIIKK
jgi:hypothetical protein